MANQTADEAIQELLNLGWTIEHRWISQLHDPDGLSDGVDRVFINTMSPEGEGIGLVYEETSGNFFTDQELYNHLWNYPDEKSEPEQMNLF